MRRILIVDDDVDLLRGQEMYLQAKGYKVKTAASMTEGLAAIESFIPDIIIVDLMMEHHDSGLVFCKRVRERSGLKHVPILMQTAVSRETGYTFHVDTPSMKQWVRAEEILTKPVPLEELEAKIRQYTDHE